MPRFAYKAKKLSGEVVEGVLEADNQRLVISKLQSMRVFPISVQEEAGGKGLQTEISMARFQRIGLKEKAVFFRQMADLLRAGLPLSKALDTLHRQTTHVKMKDVIYSLSSDVQGGTSMSDALRKFPSIFSELHASMVRAGETGGMLEAVMERLAAFTDDQLEARGKIISAMAYPAIMVLVGIGVIIVLLTFVIPRFVTMFAEAEQELPLITQFMIAISYGIKSYWWVVLIVLAFLVYAYRKFTQSPEGKMAMDRFWLKVPVIGDLILKSEISKFSRTLGTLLSNGVPILKALDIVHQVLSNQVLRERMAEVKENVKEGARLSERLAEGDLFPPVAVSMIAVGEETGEMELTLTRIAESYERETERAIKLATTLVEPAMILGMGVVVGFIVISMILPIFQLSQGVG